ncbi:putative cell division protein FtsL [Hyphomonas neptunium ATCC 15444]|uniref:Putative cell division protein FtsL n=2 Tax=Hyphomonas TaxID=85 RepID=Q0BXT5_HYPNA|nr:MULTISPECIES: septum formation initiator family protein [Hyphomonas]ABI75411.1 putative cell division protein FtsL [Hyphomonas neptunium ATCC 15444]KCZ93601.1 putative cell division protein FtsL [Hyphomonas hirschiana VP5]
MSRKVFFFGLLVAGLLIFSLYRAKYGAKDTAAELMAVEAQIEEAQREKALLETELAHMSRRDWIEEFARKELGMAPPKPGQMANESDLDEVVGPPVTTLQALTVSEDAVSEDEEGSDAASPAQTPAEAPR